MTDAAADLRLAAKWYRDTYPVPKAMKPLAERLEALADSFDHPGPLGYDESTGRMVRLEAVTVSINREFVDLYRFPTATETP